ncbi:MAG TPA: SDR family NAD(P)-dependent oxidoreductase [Acidimicrobiia bacterium]|nr:SDR family NAD(P)-dependent oxidoreductase [Acidimicrobiia bacterium]
MKIDGALAVVTGASGGIGAAIARSLHERGAGLVLTARRTPVLEELAASISGARVEPCDLADRQQVLDLGKRLSGADIVVANAALPAAGRLESFSPEEVERAVTVNLVAPMLLVHQVVPSMVARGRGHVVFISSIGGKLAPPQLSVYAATKFGVRGFARSLRQDLAGTGVGVSVVSPGSITDAGMLADAGLPAAPGTKGLSARDVGDAVVEAIERNRAEIDAAPAMVRFAARVGALFPGLIEKASATKESRAYADALADGLRHLR